MSSVDFLQQAVDYAQQSQKNAVTNWLSDYRQKSLTSLENESFPNRKKELFKYNNLSKLQNADLFQTNYSEADSTSVKSLLDSAVTIENANNIVIVDGSLNSDLSRVISDKVTITQFSDCTAAQIDYIKKNIDNSIAERNIFTKLNASITFNGLLIEVTDSVDTPIVLTYVNTGNSNSTSHSNLLANISPSTKATIVEQFISTDLTDVLNQHNQSSKFIINDNAELEHYQLNLEHEQAIHFGAQDYRLMRDARLNSFNITLGGLIKRNDIDVHHQAGGSHADINGIYLANNQQQVDYHTIIEHAVPHCTTSETFRGIVDGKAKAVFNGRIHIHPDAQKTLAELSNKNLLLSNQCEVNTKPELEIYADDVRCAHGATVAQLDKNALFYLQSRGIAKQQAELLISFGFINELIDGLANQIIADYLRPLIANMFSHK